jgi:Ulp1 family protease
MINIEDWINVIAYYWRPNIEDCEFFIIEECELFVTDKKLEVDVSLIDSSQRKLVEALMKEQASSQLRKF